MKKWLTILFIITFLFSVQAAHVWAAPVTAAGISDIRSAIDSNKLVTISGTLSTGAGQVVSVRILDPKGNTEYAGSTVSGSWGDFQFTFTMRNTTAGNYHVDLNALGLASPVTTDFQYGVNNDLKDLVTSSGGFNKAFSPAITEYAVSVDNQVSSIMVTPTVSDNTALVKVNNYAVSSGSPSDPISLKEGTNTINVAVTALNGNTKLYKVTVTRQKAISSNLTANASIDSNRQVTVSGTVSSGAGQIISIMITDPGKNVEYACETVSTIGGSYRFSYTLSNTVKGRYTAAVRALGVAQPVTAYFDYGTDAGLKNLSISSGNLSPAFSADVTSYSASVSNSINGITVTPTTNDIGASIKVNNTKVVSGSASGLISLNACVDIINVVVTAQDRVTTKTYTIVVNRDVPLPAGVSVQALINSGKQVTVSGAISSSGQQVPVMITDPNGKLEYLNAATSGTAGAFQFSYTMSNNTKGRYNVAIGVPGLLSPASTYFIYDPGNADLKNLAISSGSLNPQFASDKTQYTASVRHGKSSIQVTPTAMDSGAAIKVNDIAVTSGNASGSISVAVGDNKITIVVTSQDRTLSKTYTVTVIREEPTPPPPPPPPPPPLSSNANLGSLTISSGILDPVFAADTTGYTVSVENNIDSFTVTPTVAESYAAVKVNDTTVASGAASGAIALNVGENMVTIEVTAQNGTTKIYAIIVARADAISSDAGLSVLEITGERVTDDGVFDADMTWGGDFSSEIFEYLVTPSMVLTSVTVTPIVNEIHATVTVNEIPVESGASCKINIDQQDITIINVVVTAQDGTTTKTYIIYIPAQL